jgi:L-threonylcarbamoyladenylate synthase
VSPTTAQHVVDDLASLLDPKRDVILDGGACEIGVESTIVDTTVDPLQVLREGAVTRDQVSDLFQSGSTGDGVFSSIIIAERSSGPARASGMLASHYAPLCEVRVVDCADDAAALLAGSAGAEILDRTEDLAAYARNLYSDLRSADSRGVSMVIAVLPPPAGLGHAVRDRLTKAAAPRPART